MPSSRNSSPLSSASPSPRLLPFNTTAEAGPSNSSRPSSIASGPTSSTVELTDPEDEDDRDDMDEESDLTEEEDPTDSREDPADGYFAADEPSAGDEGDDDDEEEEEEEEVEEVEEEEEETPTTRLHHRRSSSRHESNPDTASPSLTPPPPSSVKVTSQTLPPTTSPKASLTAVASTFETSSLTAEPVGTDADEQEADVDSEVSEVEDEDEDGDVTMRADRTSPKQEDGAPEVAEEDVSGTLKDDLEAILAAGGESMSDAGVVERENGDAANAEDGDLVTPVEETSGQAEDEEDDAEVDADGAEDTGEEMAAPTIRTGHSSHAPPPTPAAMRELLRLEMKLAALRDKLYLERMEETAAEEEMIVNGTHPALIQMHDILSHRRQRLHEYAVVRHRAAVAELQKMQEADKSMVWTWWGVERDRMHWDEFEQTWSKRRRLQREKNEIDTVRILKPIPRLGAPPTRRSLNWSLGPAPSSLSAEEGLADLRLMEARRAAVASRHASPAMFASALHSQSHVSDEPRRILQQQQAIQAQAQAAPQTSTASHHHHHHHHHAFVSPRVGAGSAAASTQQFAQAVPIAATLPTRNVQSYLSRQAEAAPTLDSAMAKTTAAPPRPPEKVTGTTVPTSLGNDLFKIKEEKTTPTAQPPPNIGAAFGWRNDLRTNGMYGQPPHAVKEPVTKAGITVPERRYGGLADYLSSAARPSPVLGSATIGGVAGKSPIGGLGPSSAGGTPGSLSPSASLLSRSPGISKVEAPRTASASPATLHTASPAPFGVGSVFNASAAGAKAPSPTNVMGGTVSGVNGHVKMDMERPSSTVAGATAANTRVG